MWPRLGTSKLVSQWMLVTLIASFIAAIDGGWLAGRAALIPSRVFQGEVWRLVTWPFITLGPLEIIFTVLAIFRFGSRLAESWDDHRLLRFMTEIVLAAAAATCLIASSAGQRYQAHIGGWAIVDTLVIAWARQFPGEKRNLYNLIPLGSGRLIVVTIGAHVLLALYLGPLAVAPALVACVAAATYPPRWLMR